MTVDRLDEQSRREWEASLGLCTEPPSLDDLRVFIETRIHTVEALEAQRKRDLPTASKQLASKDNVTKGAIAKGTAVHQVVSAPSSSKSCGLCKNNHYLLFCLSAKVSKGQGRYNEEGYCREVQQYCLNCLGKNHQISSLPVSQTLPKKRPGSVR